MKHLKDVDMTYFEHMKYALGISFELSIAVIALTIHAFIPCWFEKTGSKIIKDVSEGISNQWTEY